MMEVFGKSRFLRTAQAAGDGSVLVQWAKSEPPHTEVFSQSLLWRLAGVLSVWILAALIALLLVASLALPPLREPFLLLAVLTAGAYRWPTVATALLPAALIWAPRISLAHASGELLYLRIDHLLAAGAFLRMLGTTRIPIRAGRAVAALAVLLAAMALSVTVGIFRGTLPQGAIGLAYLAQVCQLGVVFLLALQYAPALERWALPAFALPILLAAGYGVAEALAPIETLHLGPYKTFERGWFNGQANQFGGLFAAGALAGAALMCERRGRAWGMLLVPACIAGLWTTDSQQGWLGVTVGGAALVLIGRFRWLPLLVLTLIVFGIWSGPQLLDWAATPGSPMEDRLMAWGAALGQMHRAPLCGLGFGARPRGYYDSHYVLILSECGVLGFAALLLWLAETGRALGADLREGRNALNAAAFALWAAMLVQAGVASVFIVSALAGPILWEWGLAMGAGDRETAP